MKYWFGWVAELAGGSRETGIGVDSVSACFSTPAQALLYVGSGDLWRGLNLGNDHTFPSSCEIRKVWSAARISPL